MLILFCSYVPLQVCPAPFSSAEDVLLLLICETEHPSGFVEAGQAESRGHRRSWPRKGHSSVPRCAGCPGERSCAFTWAWSLYSVRGAGQHKAGASASFRREKPHRRLPAEEQIRRDAPHLHWGELITDLIEKKCCSIKLHQVTSHLLRYLLLQYNIINVTLLIFYIF